MVFRTIALFVTTSALGVALACGGAPCDSCDKGAKTASASATDLKTVDGIALALTVSGVHCSGTASSAHAALIKIDGVKAATVDPTGRANVRFDAAKTSADAIIAAVAKSGNFTATTRDDA